VPPGTAQTMPFAAQVQTEQAVITTGIVGHTVSFTTQVLNQSTEGDNGWASLLPTKMQRAEDAIGRTINEMMMGDSGTAVGQNGLLASITTGSSASGGATQTVIVGPNANLYQLYPGRFVDVRTRSSGVLLGTARVKILTLVEATGTLTVQYEDGSNTSFANATTDGLYITGSYGSSINGFGAAVATTGIFESINKANVWAWQGVDASPGSATDPGIAVWDAAERKVYAHSGRSPQFWLADPAVVDKYTQGLTVQARWAGEDGQLESGWTGIRYRNKLIVPDFDMPTGTAYGPQLEDMAIYTLDDGPDWDDHTGSVFQRFSARTLPVEAWLVWMLQVGYTACNALCKIGNLNRAS